MLTHLKVTNFQSISEIDIELGKYTVVVGRSNSGKSAILRALHTLVRNSFIPSYVRTGKGSTQITTTFDDLTVTTIRGKESTYSFSQGDGDTEVYTKCGRTVPEAIERLLAMPLVADEDVFFTNQFDLPFLVAGKATRASAVIGTLTNAVLVNSLAQETNRVRLNTKQRITVRQDDLARLEAEKDEFSDLPRLEEILFTVQCLQAEYDRVQGLYDRLFDLIRRADSITLVEVPTVPEVDLERLRELSEASHKLQAMIGQADSITLVDVPDVGGLDEQFFELESVDRQVRILEKLVRVITDQKKKYIQSLEDLEKVDKNIQRVEERLSAFAVCSACGQVLP